MRIATYNVEWFANLFDDAGRLLDDQDWSGRQDVTRSQQIAALTHVFRALDADAVLVIEAPDSSRHRDGTVALETFAAHAGIRARKALIGFVNDTQQEIILLYDPDTMQARHDPVGEETGKKGSRTAAALRRHLPDRPRYRRDRRPRAVFQAAAGSRDRQRSGPLSPDRGAREIQGPAWRRGP